MRQRRRVTTSLTTKGPNKNPFTVIRKEFMRSDGGIDHAADILKDYGDLLAEEVKLYIFEQQGGARWPDLNEQYLRSKIANDLDERKLIAVGDYVAAIKARKRSGGMKVLVGLPDEKHYSGLPYSELGRILEYGHKGFRRIGEGLIPPRPHWRPVWARWRKKMHRVSAEMSKEVSSKLFPRVGQKLRTVKKKL